jgi:integrase/recombinase XerD
MREGVSMKEANQLLQYVQRFFQEYLRVHRGMSPNTVFAYRDTIKLFMRFLTTHTGREPARISLDHLQPDAVLAFLGDIETKGNCVTTRNLRLSALRTFFGYLVTQDTLRVGQYQRVIAIPLKQASQPLMGYLEVEEVKAILQSIDQRTETGRRDYILINLLYNTGARVQEICDLRREDVSKSPPSVVITGKGRKTRQVPLWPETATILREYMNDGDPQERVFQNSRGMPLTRFGIHHIIGTRIRAAATACPSLAKKKVTPHTFRHTTAMHLLQSGVELTVIKSWLGHVQISTTHAYIEIDLKMKQKALAQCTPVHDGNKLNEVIRHNDDVIGWLDSL